MKENNRNKRLLKNLPQSERKILSDFLYKVSGTLNLSERENDKIIADVLKLAEYYFSQGLNAAEISARVGENIFGDGFYTNGADEWFELDSAAKVYPLIMTSDAMTVFRVSAYLTERIVPEILQIALLSTIKRFPLFATTLKRGWFWHYMDSTRKRFTVQEENDLPCVQMNLSTRTAVSFRVQYYYKRISLEVFHILTDGSGALAFLKALVAEYLRLAGKSFSYGNDIFKVSEQPDKDEYLNNFDYGDKAEKAGGFSQKPAVQGAGKRTAFKPAKVINLIMDSNVLHQKASALGVTVTAFLLSAIFCAVKANCSATKGELRIQVPVDMRKFYKSRTLRNFSLYTFISVPLSGDFSFETLASSCAAQLKRNVTKPNMDKMMLSTKNIVKNPLMRVTPLFLKKPAVKLAYKFIGEKVITTTLSNLGVVKADFDGNVDMLDFILSPPSVNRMNCAAITYNDKTVFSVITNTHEPCFENNLMRIFSERGIEFSVKQTER